MSAAAGGSAVTEWPTDRRSAPKRPGQRCIVPASAPRKDVGVVTKAGRIRKPIEGSGAAADHAEEAQETRADRQVPVPGLALPERAASESGTRVGPADDPAEAEAEATARSIVE